MRVNTNLKRIYQAILSYTGLILFMSGLLIFTPLLALVVWHDELAYSMGFVLPATALSGIGFVFWRIFHPRNSVVLTIQEGGIVVLLSWVIMCLFSALPFMAVQGLNFTQSVFESVSGYTTTGLSVVDVNSAPHIILLWRSIMQLVGGAGLAILMLAAITGPIGPGLYIAEGRSEQLAPHVLRSARLVVILNSGYAIIGIIAYRLAGMSMFDSINHAFTAVSTGGFSTRPESIGYWNSTAIEVVTILLIILGSTNFLTVYLLLQGKLKAVYHNGEIRLTSILIPISFLILLLFVGSSLYPSLDKRIRVSIFEAVSALTTTGFSTVSYSNWNSLGLFVLTILMIIGGGTCSTAGGVKQYRVYVLFKSLFLEIIRPLLPRTAVVERHIWQGENKVFINDRLIRQVAIFAFLYIVVYTIGSGIIAAHGYKLEEAMFEFASSLSDVGLSIGITSASSPPMVLWTEIMGMFFGRLEFFVIFVSLIKIIRDFCPF